MGILSTLSSAASSLALWHIALFFVVTRLLWNRYGTGLSHVPSPFLQSTQRGQEFDMELHRKYGKVVRVGPRLVSVTDPNEINTIYGVTRNFYKSSFYDPSTPYDDEGIVPDPFVLKDKQMHARMKRNPANAYSMSSLVQLEPYIDEVSSRAFQVLDRETETTGKAGIDFGHLLHRYAMDTVLMLTFGQTMDFLEKGDENNILAAFDVIMPYMSTIGQISWLHKFLAGNALGAKLILGRMRFEEGLMDIATTQVQKFKQELDTRPANAPCTFVQRLLLNQKANTESLTHREIVTHALGNITAGSDTTSTTMRTIIYHTLKNPDSYRKLCEEVRSHCTACPVPFTTAKNLPYLNAVIKEALRIHFAMAIMLGRTAPRDGATIGGFYMPPGTEVGINAWLLHRDPDIFPDPEAWKPERWLTEDAEHLSRMNKAFFAFGAGQHVCSGRHISTMEISKLIPSLLLRYELALADPGREWTYRSTMLAIQKDLFVVVKKREGVRNGLVPCCKH
ncbi:cytochrome P450 [Aspergillus stella-maris]|uniref:cytochrome P450 n=1 Tax=Aspergillus stella-maris TaxID=1810926 RepID=UPI003CCD258C